MPSQLGTEQRPLRVAIVGAGPSGFYTADALFAKKEYHVTVDMYEKLPVPYGLVRYGVAPDHPKIKNVIKVYEKTALRNEFQFLGNVAVGDDVTVEELKNYYDAVVFTSGAMTDKKLGIPGEDLPGSYTATEFVGWYNGHPDYQNRTFDLSSEVAVIIGQGNVAMNVTRVLCKTMDELSKTDITRKSLEVLAASRLKKIHLLGRRGPVQAAFTPPEIREFGDFVEWDPILDPQFLDINENSRIELNDPANVFRKKNWEILERFAAQGAFGGEKRFILHFLRSPIEIAGKGRVEKIILEKNQLKGEPNHQKARGTGETIELPCGMVFSSVGYRGVPIKGIPFDDKAGIFPNNGGRILDKDQIMPGLYCAGWIKRGASGSIGTNKSDSAATVLNILSDLDDLPPCPLPHRQAVADFFSKKNIRVVNFHDWQKIDAAEIERGQKLGKSREKFTSIEEMLSVL